MPFPSIAANRDLEPEQLKRALRGDVDWIVMKALEKDRVRRYESANGFVMIDEAKAWLCEAEAIELDCVFPTDPFAR